MVLALIGGKEISLKIKKQIEGDFDNVEVVHYHNVQNFATTSITAKKHIDRFFILEGGLNGGVEVLSDFYNFLLKWYTGSRVIFFIKSVDELQSYMDVLNSPNYLLVLADKLKVRLLQDLVLGNSEELAGRYPDTVFVSNVKLIEELVDLKQKETVEPRREEKKAGILGKVVNFFKKEEVVLPEDKSLESLEVLEQGVEVPSVGKGGLKRVKSGGVSRPVVEILTPVEEVLIDEEDFIEKPLKLEKPKTKEVEVEEEDLEGEVFGFEEDLLDEDDIPVLGEDQEVEDGKVVSKEGSFTSGLVVEDTYIDLEEDFGLALTDIEFDVASVIPEVDMRGLDSLITEVESYLGEDDEESGNVELPLGDLVGVDLDKAERVFKEATAPKPKIIEKVVEKVKVEEKIVERVVHSSASSMRYNGIKFVVVTGDRKTGITTTALEVAKVFAKNERTLLVDLDLDRHGLILHLDLGDLFSNEDYVYNNLLFVTEQNLKEVVYRSKKHKLFTLQASIGIDIPEGAVTDRVVPTILNQSLFTTVVIDCPVEYLGLLEDMLIYSTILVCTEETHKGVLDTLISLDNLKLKQKFLMKNMYYVVRGKGKEVEFKNSLQELLEILEFKGSISYSSIEVLGSQASMGSLVEKLK